MREHRNTRIAGIGMTSQRTRERLVTRLRASGIENAQVLDAIRMTPRHLFVDEALATRAYDDVSLPIGFGQTISQPLSVARMTEMIVAIQPKKVLEIGTGSGYQAAVLSGLVAKLYTIERIEALYVRARRIFSELGLRNVYCKYGDGMAGWRDAAPYDAIIATAAPENIPDALLDQLDLGGRMVIPVGNQEKQQLFLVTRTETGYDEKVIDAAMFVPMLYGAR